MSAVSDDMSGFSDITTFSVSAQYIGCHGYGSGYHGYGLGYHGYGSGYLGYSLGY